MVKTIEEGFREFHSRLTPSDNESTIASQHRASIEACLRQNHGMITLFRTGSFGFGTSIYGYSDVDYFAEIPTQNLSQHSSYSLQLIRQALTNRFPYTDVSVRTPAVAIFFGGGEEVTEVVPANFLKSTDSYGGYRVYEIPDGNDGWTKSSPEKHKGWIKQLDDKLGKKVKPLIRFIKAWRYYQNVPLTSFYLELRVAKYSSEQESIAYSIDMKIFLNQLLRTGLASIQDPMGVSGLVQPCSTPNQKEDALSKLTSAVSRADKAYAEEEAGNIKDAFYWWNMLYNGKFPSYYS